MRLSGTAFPPKSSVRHPAWLDVSQVNSLDLVIDGQIITDDLRNIEVSVPVGQLPIRFHFTNGWMFVTERSPAMMTWLNTHKKSGFVDKLESNFFAWFFSALLCVAVVVGSYLYVLPWLSHKIAEAVPDYAAIALGEKVLQGFDEQWQPSALSASEQEQIRQRVVQHLEQLEELPYSVEVYFRSSNMGANAFALPGGKIVILDDLVKLAESEQQLDSIILHELGHVHHQHMLKKLVHSSVLSVGVSLMTGESSGIIDNLAGVGVFFLANGHSREVESEADEYAKRSMLTIYGTSEPMAEMFELFSQQEGMPVPEWLNSHPDFEQRIQAVRD
ncbi:M48 family metallopeptidase [Vibrio renipiscarius]|uniref:M48 family metallopeptidase n=1 Tax=Vibrio renipiscarius TaxID=1461322 RepID=UPI00354E6990